MEQQPLGNSEPHIKEENTKPKDRGQEPAEKKIIFYCYWGSPVVAVSVADVAFVAFAYVTRVVVSVEQFNMIFYDIFLL